MAAKKKTEANAALQSWLDDVAAYERAFKTWEGRVEKILKRYRDEPRTGKSTWTEARFNILWSNVQTLVAATFSKLPKPDVTRRFRDQDPTGRVAALILERALEYHVQHYPEYRSAIKANVYDRFLGGRGTAWVRYEPHFRALPEQPADGDQVTDDVDTPDEELDYECVAVDYVDYRDFGHSVARTWEEVGRVWRKVYMTREALIERFGDAGKTVPLDADPRQKAPDKAYGSQDARECATVYEGWDKGERRAVWFSKAGREFLDEKDDPLGLEDVFPCPKPIFATLTNDSLIPTPDFTLYQDQANELDLLSDRIDGLVKALKVCGGYDASIPELGRIFTEAEQGTLIPVKNWAAFAEKNGLQGALSLVDLKPTAEALRAAYEAFEQVKGQIHEITGISDIIRGQTQASETATAQQLKGQYASLRLKTYQDEVAQYASDILALMGQIICKKFAPETIAKIGGAEQLTPQDQAAVPQAMALLVGEERMADPEAESGPNPVRTFRIEVNADSLVYMDEQAEQQARTEFLTATGAYLENVSKALMGVPPQMTGVLIPLLMDMLKFGVTGYRVGKNIEGAFDEAAERLKQIAAQAPAQQGPSEEQMKQVQEQAQMQADAKVAQQNATKEIEHAKRSADLDIRELKFGAEKSIAEQDIQRQHEELKSAQREHQLTVKESDHAVRMNEDRAGMAKEKATMEEERANKAAEVAEAAEEGRQKGSRTLEQSVEILGELSKSMQASQQKLMEGLAQLGKMVAAPKKVIRGPNGKIERVEIEA